MPGEIKSLLIDRVCLEKSNISYKFHCKVFGADVIDILQVLNINIFVIMMG